MDDNTPKPNGANGELKTLHTYSSDMADAVRLHETSVIKIALAEQKKHEVEDLYKKAEGSNISKFFLFFFGLVIIAGSIGGVYYLMQKKAAENMPPVQIQKIDTFIAFDTQSFIDTTNADGSTDISSQILAEAKSAGSGSLKAIFLTKTVNGKSELISGADFLSLIKATPPQTLVRSLADQYMIGAYTKPGSLEVVGAPKKSHLFMILKTNDFSQTYASMLEWEKTMLDNMFTLFAIDISGARSSLFEKPFKDVTINNKDARAIYDDSGQEVLYYMFVDKDKFIIADDEDTIKEVVSRLITKNIKPL
jgi:hypothetical protein